MLVRKRIINKRNREPKKKVIKINLNVNIGTINNIVNKMTKRKICSISNSSISDSSVNDSKTSSVNDSNNTNTNSYNTTYSPENSESKTEEDDILYDINAFSDEDSVSQILNSCLFDDIFNDVNLEKKGQSSIQQKFNIETSSNSDNSDSDSCEFQNEFHKKKRKTTNSPQVSNTSQTNSKLPVFVQNPKIILESFNELEKILEGQKTLADAKHYVNSRLNYNESRQYDNRKDRLRLKCLTCNKKEAVYGCWLCGLACGLDFASRMHFCFKCAGISLETPNQGHYSWNPTSLENTISSPNSRHILSAQAKFEELKLKRDKISPNL